MIESYRVDGLHVERTPATDEAAPPLLLVHGASHGAWCWELWLAHLAGEGREAYALSLRNHPGSAPVDAQVFLRDLRVADYAADVAAVADAIGRPLVVVGHSMGGIVGQRFAADYAARGQAVAGLVLIASVAPGPLDAPLQKPFPTDRGYLHDREATTRRYFYNIPPERLKSALDRLVPESPAIINEMLGPPGVHVTPDDIPCPVLSITAGRDGTLVPRDDALARYYGGEHLHFPDDGHDLMLEEGWRAALEGTLDWMARRVAAP